MLQRCNLSQHAAREHNSKLQQLLQEMQQQNAAGTIMHQQTSSASAEMASAPAATVQAMRNSRDSPARVRRESRASPGSASVKSRGRRGVTACSRQCVMFAPLSVMFHVVAANKCMHQFVQDVVFMYGCKDSC